MSSIRDTLTAEAIEAEGRRDEPPGHMHRARVGTGGTSHVYTVRMPADRLAELRAVAENSGGTTVGADAPLGAGTARR